MKFPEGTGIWALVVLGVVFNILTLKFGPWFVVLFTVLGMAGMLIYAAVQKFLGQFEAQEREAIYREQLKNKEKEP